MKCDIKFMCIESRMLNVASVCSQLGLSFSEDVFVDYEMRHNPYYSSAKAFALPMSEGTTHRCVLQDDVDICENFQDALNELVNAYPDAVFSLFCTSKKMNNYPENSVIKTGGQIWGPAVVIPVKYLEAMRQDHELACPSLEHDDVFYSDYCWRHKIPVLTTIPNIVQHLGKDSSLGHSYNFVSPCCNLENPVGRKWENMTSSSLGMPHGVINKEKRTEYYYKSREDLK
jgi:hypothetical protein